MFILISEFIGRLHPVLVHLPVGILITACIFQWLTAKGRFHSLYPAIPILVFLGMLGAVASVISGYILSLSDDYEMEMIILHQWSGISTAVVSVVFFVIQRNNASQKLKHVIAVVLFLLIIFTGHFGGSITHGSDYLSLSGSVTPDSVEQKPIPDIQEAVVYSDVVQPLLQRKCYSCHGKNKQKGGLRLDDSARLWKGGKDGIVLVAGNADESEMIRRLLLPRNDEDHMPPKEKPSLTEQEIALLHWWVSSGASFQKKVKELDQTDKIKPVLTALQNKGIEKKVQSDIPLEPVQQGDSAAMNTLKERGVVILPLSQNTNYLMANFITADSIQDKDLALLLPLREQLVWLKLGNTLITDSSLATIASCKNITRLQLDHTNISDTGLSYLKSMKNLQYLNLVGTRVTLQGMLQLKGLKNIRSFYLYQTLIRSSEWQILKNNFPNIIIDSGGYSVPFLVSDTTEVKEKKKI